MLCVLQCLSLLLDVLVKIQHHEKTWFDICISGNPLIHVFSSCQRLLVWKDFGSSSSQPDLLLPLAWSRHADSSQIIWNLEINIMRLSWSYRSLSFLFPFSEIYGKNTKFDFEPGTLFSELLECHLADPGPISYRFWLDESFSQLVLTHDLGVVSTLLLWLKLG